MAQELALALIRKNQPKLEVLSGKVKALNQEIMVHFKNAVTGAKEAGKWLIDMKDLLPHGHFERYVEDHTEIASRTARRYMLLHEKWDEIEDKLGPDAYVSTIDGCLKIVQPPPPKRPALADFPPTEVLSSGEDNEEGRSEDVEAAIKEVRERRQGSDRRAEGGDVGCEDGTETSRARSSKDPIKACEEDLERLFGEITRRLEDYHAVKPNRLQFDCQQGLDHVYGDFRKWKKTPKS